MASLPGNNSIRDDLSISDNARLAELECFESESLISSLLLPKVAIFVDFLYIRQGSKRPMADMKTNKEKVAWTGRLLAVQPRIRLMRSFDQRHHGYLGYVLRISGLFNDESGEFLIAVGKGAHSKHQFHSGMELSGLSIPLDDQRLEVAGFYKTTRIKIEKDPSDIPQKRPPFHGVPPDLTIYRARGHRRLDAKTYAVKCIKCIWGCRMPVEIIIDQWNPSKKRYRFETFCYGPKSCPFYRPGAIRKVPGRKGMTWEEEDWVDEDATAHRAPDD